MGSLDKMRGFIIALTFVAACSALSRDAQWEEFKLKYKKGYRNLEQDSERKAIFMSNLDNIEAHNVKFEAGQSTYKQGVNQYSDMSFDEFQNTILMSEEKVAKKEFPAKTQTTPRYHPDSHDWKYVMGSVRNQGSCGSCWAFGAVGTVEGVWAMAGNDKLDLSEQQLVDCAQGDCDGGWADDGLDTIIRKGGSCLESDYPYHATNGYYCESCTPAVSISGYNFINVHYEGTDTLADSLYNNGPHVVYVYVNDNWRHYTYGIFDDPYCSTTSYNHAVVNVGYDKTEGYWTIRNSWASSWGESGHIRMNMGKNVCNIERYAWVPYL